MVYIVRIKIDDHEDLQESFYLFQELNGVYESLQQHHTRWSAYEWHGYQKIPELPTIDNVRDLISAPSTDGGNGNMKVIYSFGDLPCVYPHHGFLIEFEVCTGTVN